MKTVGMTNEGKFLVELTEEEVMELTDLSRADKGEGPDRFIMPSAHLRTRVDYDLTQALIKVRKFVDIRVRLNALKNHIEMMEEDIDGIPSTHSTLS